MRTAAFVRRGPALLSYISFSSISALLTLCVIATLRHGTAHAAGPVEKPLSWRVLAPIESGDLLLFPVLREDSNSRASTPFLTLDEGLRDGTVQVTEAGRLGGLVRPRGRTAGPRPGQGFGDQVNQLVLVNNAGKPLLLLAGEVVTGGKQDRVIAKDRIVPPGADPIDLSVFCIEPGRWVESSPTFGASSKAPAGGFMVQPMVREQAMAAKDQQRVWNSVRNALSTFNSAIADPPGAVQGGSYAKAMQSDTVRAQVDDTAAPLTRDREQVLAQLRRQGAVGVVVAVHNQIVWADVFASTDLLARYWTKLVRSYAAESLDRHDAMTEHPRPSPSDAQHFLDMPLAGTETSEGAVGIYRYREIKAGGTATFTLESLLPQARYDVHISKMRLRHESPATLLPLDDPFSPPPHPEFRRLPEPLTPYR